MYLSALISKQDCSHIWGVEFLVRIWEQKDENWYCNSTVYCTSMSEKFPNTISDVGTLEVIKYC